jgi:hypothetical protein
MYIRHRHIASSYSHLCGLASRESGEVKLSRSSSDWGLDITLPPADGDPAWRAFGTLFPDLRELEGHAWHLLRWANAYRPARPGSSGDASTQCDESEK